MYIEVNLKLIYIFKKVAFYLVFTIEEDTCVLFIRVCMQIDKEMI